MKKPEITWVSAGAICEEITRGLARDFKCSRPQPRNHIMGFRGEPKKKNPLLQILA